MENVNYKGSYLWKLRHTTEHVFNQAVEELFPKLIMRAMGPPIEDGWYNDSRWGIEVNDSMFGKIEKRMELIVKANLPIVFKEISEMEARELFQDNPFKIELIDEYVKEGKSLSVYYTGDPEKSAGGYKNKIAQENAKNLPGDAVFCDLCAGPHINNTGEIKAFKLLSVAGAYWRGNEKNEMLTRVYGTTFETKDELEKYITQIEEAKRRDHRKIVKEQGLVVFSDLVGAGLPIYTPRGTIMRNGIYNYSRELNEKIGYQEVHTPNYNRAELFKVSGHYDKYKDDMLKVKSNYSDEELFLKPMNCPQHTQIYASQLRSYKDLPIRIADFANLARDERPGELHGMLRTRIFAQDDGHAFLRPDQIAEEFRNVHGVIKEALNTYGLEYYVRLSLRDPNAKEKYLGDDAIWESAESKLKEMVAELGSEYIEAEGEAAIYGPKMDFIAKDSLNREWQLSTIQIDMNMPHRFGLKYVDENGQDQEPVMIHRAIVGSERFIGILIEHFAGAFPAWLHPEQVAIIPVSEKFNDYAKKIELVLKKFIPKLRTKLFDDSERMQKRIRDAQVMKIPYMLVLGGKEEELGVVNVRLRSGEELGVMDINGFVDRIDSIISSKSLEL